MRRAGELLLGIGHGSTRRRIVQLVLAMIVMSPSLASTPPGAPADIVLFNGVIHTMTPERPMAAAVAIRNGRFEAVGDRRDIEKLAGRSTLRIDLRGRPAIPGLIDAHVHPLEAVAAKLFSCNFDPNLQPDALGQSLRQCADRAADSAWIVGGTWNVGYFETHHVESPRELLDRYSAGHPVFLWDDSGHNGWANSRALDMAGVTQASEDPDGGRIVRDAATGAPNGVLIEQARFLVAAKLPDWNEEQYRTAVLETLRTAAGFGITGIEDAYTSAAELRAYHDMDRNAGMTLHVATCIATFNGYRDKPLDYDALVRLRAAYASAHVATNCVKIIDDGVPTAARSAAMLAPYTPHEGFADGWSGKLLVEEPTLTQDVTELEKRGFKVKIHTAGDRSVHIALNAIEKAHPVSGRYDLRDELAHAGFVDPADIPRFRTLNVVADFSPYIWFPSPTIESIRAAVGPRAERYWPIRTLLEAGAPVLAGSDWPAAVKSMNPWVGIEAMVTRRDPDGASTGALWPDQAVTLDQALRIFTVENAKALHVPHVTGSISVGDSADLIVLGQDVFHRPSQQIHETSVDLTIFAGKIVHEE
jgi:predicted amidohydrolase YtcJ